MEVLDEELVLLGPGHGISHESGMARVYLGGLVARKLRRFKRELNAE
jgi:hypothetical protein